MRVQRWIGVALAGAFGLVALTYLLFQSAAPQGQPVVINGTAVPPLPTLDGSRVERGAAVYAAYCADCHGASLEGAANWKQPLADGSFPPPPHDSTGHTWHHPDALLLQIIAEGGDPAYNSQMPAFGGRLTEADMRALLEFMKSHWGKDREFQWWITMTSRRQP